MKIKKIFHYKIVTVYVIIQSGSQAEAEEAAIFSGFFLQSDD